MPKFDLSYEGQMKVEDLKNRLERANSELKEKSATMQNTVTTLGPSIGIFEEQLNSLVSEVKSAQERGEQGIEMLSQKLGQLASQIQEIRYRGLN